MCVSKEGYEERKKALIRLQTNIQINNMQEKEIGIISFETSKCTQSEQSHGCI